MKKYLLVLCLVFFGISVSTAQIKTTPSTIERLSGISTLSNISFNSGGGLSVNGTTDVVLNADDDIGIYAGDNIYIDAGGVRRMVFSSSGNIGIGTSSPQASLEIVGDIPGNVGGFNAGQLQIRSTSTSANASAIITGHSSFTGNTQLWYMGSPSSGNQSVAFYNRQNDEMIFGTNNTRRMTITGGGDIGIGTSNPTSDLDLRGSLVLENGTNAQLYTGTGSSELNRYLLLLNSPSSATASGLKTGGLLVADSYSYANPGKNELVVKGDVTIGDEVIKDTGTNSLGFGARLRPLSDNTYDLGVSTRRWKDLFLSGSSFINGSVDIDNGLEASAGTASNAGFFDGPVCTNNGYFTCSDSRLKEKTIEIENAADIISQLRPVEYNYKTKGIDFQHFPSERQYGLLAQELEKVLPSLIKDNIAIIYDELDVENQGDESEMDTPKGTSTLQYKSVNYIGLIPFLIANAQEQQKIIEEKEARITKIEEELARLKTLVEKLASGNIQSRTEVLHQIPSLKQNQPNPFHENTTIQYYLPESSQQATLNITDINGKIIKVIQLQETGQGQIELQTETLGAGTYIYSLIVNGQIVESKQMILTR